jgi:hypothetical protein
MTIAGIRWVVGQPRWGILKRGDFLTAFKVGFGRLTEGGPIGILKGQTNPEV